MWRIVWGLTRLPIVEGTDLAPFTHAQARPIQQQQQPSIHRLQTAIGDIQSRRGIEQPTKLVGGVNVGAIAAAAAWVGSWVAETRRHGLD